MRKESYELTLALLLKHKKYCKSVGATTVVVDEAIENVGRTLELFEKEEDSKSTLVDVIVEVTFKAIKTFIVSVDKKILQNSTDKELEEYLRDLVQDEGEVYEDLHDEVMDKNTELYYFECEQP